MPSTPPARSNSGHAVPGAKKAPAAISVLTSPESSKTVGKSTAAGSKGASIDLAHNAQVRAQVKPAPKDSSDVPGHLRDPSCLINPAQQAVVHKIVGEVEECRLDGLSKSEASNSSRAQVRQHASNDWAEQGGVKQVQQSKGPKY